MTGQKKTIAVIGGRQDVLPFIALGARACVTEDPEEARRALVDFSKEGLPVILISDDLLRNVNDTADMISKSSGAAVTALPGKRGRSIFSRMRIQEQIRKAIGINIEELGIRE